MSNDMNKIKSFLYNKTTIMFIPHSQKSVFNIHISHWLLYVTVFVFIALSISSIILTPSINQKIVKYKYFKESNSDYEEQINKTKTFLPTITSAQEDISKELTGIFKTMGLNENRIQNTASNTDFNTKNLDNDQYIYFLDYLGNKIQNIGLYVDKFKVFFKTMPAILPTNAHFYVSSPYGVRVHPVTKARKFHDGIDMAIIPGTPVFATADGIIDEAGWRGGYGVAVYIKHKDGYESRYGHLMRLANNIGKSQFIRRGQVLGYVGASGIATGYHLHYEIRINGESADPTRFLYIDRFR